LKKTAQLLTAVKPDCQYKITLNLTGGHAAEFTYTDREMARAHWQQLGAQGVVGGQVIKHQAFEEFGLESKITQ
jgi:hypothetical protein